MNPTLQKILFVLYFTSLGVGMYFKSKETDDLMDPDSDWNFIAIIIDIFKSVLMFIPLINTGLAIYYTIRYYKK